MLDPEQNVTFNDHYLEVDYDLSDVLFITTANSLNMPQPLLDRMEIIRIPGYTEDEKLEIAKRHLLPKQYENNGLKKAEFSVSEDALRDLIRRYTREAGVRSLEREIGNLARKAVREHRAEEGEDRFEITAANLPDYAGVWKYRFGETDQEDQVGIVTGLAWTEVGGDLLTIEAVAMPGQGRDDRDRQPEGRDAGIDLRRAVVTCARARSNTASSRPCSARATSTSTCRKARRRRTARQRAWRWRRRLFRCSPAFRSARISP